MRNTWILPLWILALCSGTASAQQPPNPCDDIPFNQVAENPDVIYFASDEWGKDQYRSITYFVYEGLPGTVISGQGSLTDFTTPKAAVTRVPEIPNCYALSTTPLRDSPSVKKDRTVYHLRGVINNAADPSLGSNLGEPSNAFLFGQPTPIPTKPAPPVTRVGGKL